MQREWGEREWGAKGVGAKGGGWAKGVGGKGVGVGKVPSNIFLIKKNILDNELKRNIKIIFVF